MSSFAATNGARILQSAFDTTFGQPSTSATAIGQLNPEQADMFLDFVIDQTQLKQKANILKMGASQRRIPKTSLADKVLWPGTSGADIAYDQYTKASASEVNLQTKLVKGVVEIYDEELEDNVEGPGYRDHIMRMLATRVGNQIESAAINGVSTNGSPAAVDVNQLFNGWSYLTQNNGGHLVVGDTTNALWADRYISFAKLSKLIKAMPVKYRNLNWGLNFFISPNVYQDVYDLYGGRQTPGGDTVYTAGGPENQGYGLRPLQYGSYPMWMVPLLPETGFQAVTGSNSLSTTTNNGSTLAPGSTSMTLTAVTHITAGDSLLLGAGATAEALTVTGVVGSVVSFTVAANTRGTGTQYAHADGATVVRGTGDSSFVLMTHSSNLVIGIQRDIRIEFERRARLGAWYMVVTMRFDVQMINPDASAMLTGLAVK